MIVPELIGDTKLIARFNGMPSKVAAAVSAKLDSLAALLVAKVQNSYLSGQSLKVQTNKLRSGIHWENEDSGQVQMRSVKPSDNVKAYAGWEYGFAQKVIYGKRGILSDFNSNNPKGFFASTLKKTVIIPAQPARPYLRPALKDLTPAIVKGLEQTVIGAIK